MHWQHSDLESMTPVPPVLWYWVNEISPGCVGAFTRSGHPQGALLDPIIMLALELAWQRGKCSPITPRSFRAASER